MLFSCSIQDFRTHRRGVAALAVALALFRLACAPLAAIAAEEPELVPAPNPEEATAGFDPGQLKRAAIFTLVMLSLTGTAAPAVTNATIATDTEPPKGARELYNTGTARLNEGKFDDAQSLLRAALAENDRGVMPAALYNLGHTRYELGQKHLKRAMERSRANELPRAQAAADQALDSARAALASGEVDALIQAYRRGAGVRRDIRDVTTAIEQALKQFNSVLTTWERASADFRGVDEHGSPDTNATLNASLIDHRIADLIDQIRMQQQALMNGAQAGKDLKEAMKQMRGRLPPGALNSFPGGDGEDDEENDPKDGSGDREQRNPAQKPISKEQAEQLLRGLRLDSNRTMPENIRGQKPVKREGGDW